MTLATTWRWAQVLELELGTQIWDAVELVSIITNLLGFRSLEMVTPSHPGGGDNSGYRGNNRAGDPQGLEGHHLMVPDPTLNGIPSSSDIRTALPIQRGCRPGAQ